jgi:hypothetical protein
VAASVPRASRRDRPPLPPRPPARRSAHGGRVRRGAHGAVRHGASAAGGLAEGRFDGRRAPHASRLTPLTPHASAAPPFQKVARLAPQPSPCPHRTSTGHAAAQPLGPSARRGLLPAAAAAGARARGRRARGRRARGRRARAARARPPHAWARRRRPGRRRPGYGLHGAAARARRGARARRWAAAGPRRGAALSLRAGARLLAHRAAGRRSIARCWGRCARWRVGWDGRASCGGAYPSAM